VKSTPRDSSPGNGRPEKKTHESHGVEWVNIKDKKNGEGEDKFVKKKSLEERFETEKGAFENEKVRSG